MIRALALVLIAALTAAGLLGVALSIERQRGAPIHLPPSRTAARDAELPPDELVVAGLRDAVRAALFALRARERTRATHALDAALRASRVLARVDAGLRPVHDHLDHARLALGVGAPGQATRELEQALLEVEPAGLKVLRSRGAPPLAEQASGYLGATVITARGVPVGELVGLRTRERRVVEAVLALGAGRGVRGLFGRGGARVLVPARLLTYGEPDPLRPTRVTIASLAADAAALLEELGPAVRLDEEAPAGRDPTEPLEGPAEEPLERLLRRDREAVSATRPRAPSSSPAGVASQPPGAPLARVPLALLSERRVAPATRPVLEVVGRAPPEVRLGDPFELVVALRNLSDREVHGITLHERPGRGVALQEATSWPVGSLEPGEERRVVLRGLATAPGEGEACLAVSYAPLLCAPVEVEAAPERAR